MATVNMSIRMDTELKKQADAMFADMGLNMTTAMNMFLRQVVRQGKIPFEIGVERPNRKTVKAMKEGDKLINDPNAKSYTFDEFAEEMKNW